MRKLYIAEKRDLAEVVVQALASLSGLTPETHYGTKKSGYIVVGNDAVTWLQGHMYDSCSPEAFGYSFSAIENLPIIINPDDWKYEIIKGYGWNAIQEPIIKKLLKEYDTIVNVGDPEREGQFLIDLSLKQWGIDPFAPNVYRLWFEDLLIPTMKRAIEDEFLNAEKTTLFQSAFLRSMLDYEWGMTFTELVTELVKRGGGFGLFSVGRLQTTIQRIIRDRDKARRDFRPVDHFQPVVSFQHPKGTFDARWKWPEGTVLDEAGRLIDRATVDAMMAKIAGQVGTVTSYQSTPKTTAQPLPFHLASITVELAARYNYTAAQTLELAKKLYLPDSLSSYPRGDSRYLTRAFREIDLPTIMENLSHIDEFGELVSKADLSITSRCWDDSKVKDHHALVPTKKLDRAEWEKLNEAEKNFMRATCTQLIAQFYPPVRYDALEAEIACGGEVFRATGRTITDPGWKSLFQNAPEELADADDKIPTIPALASGETVQQIKANPGAKRTTIPPRLNDGSLIALLEAPSSLIEDGNLKKIFRETAGIGRPSTRSTTIETLIQRGYIIRPTKNKPLELETTPVGYNMIEVLPEGLKSIAMTAQWEDRLSRVREGTETIASIKADVEEQMKAICSEMLKKYGATGLQIDGMVKCEPMAGDGEVCPKCGQGHLKTIFIQRDGKLKRFLVCNRGREVCDYIKSDVEPLPGDGEVCPKCGKGHLKTISYPDRKHPGKTKRALVCDQPRDDCGYIKSDTPPLPGDGDICPKCGKGHLKTIPYEDKRNHAPRRGLICDQGQGKCDYFKSDTVPMEGTGTVCPTCRKGHLITIDYPDKNKKFGFKRALVCDQGRDKCNFVKHDDNEPPVRPLPGDGAVCNKCGVGHMKTIRFMATNPDNPTGPKRKVTALACDRGREACGNLVFADDIPPSPLPGDGKVCSKCGTGHMKTKMIPSKSDKTKKYIALACDNKDCRNLEFPDDRSKRK